MRRALITGVTGQDGSYLSELLLDKGYEVYGTLRFSVNPSEKNLPYEVTQNDRFHLLAADMQDSASLDRVVRESQPDEIYNLAAISFAPVSWEIASQTMDVNATGFLRLIEAVRRNKPDARVYQASTSEMYGRVRQFPQNESTPFIPVHPYGTSKLAAHNAARVYREQYGMFVSCGILFNHESPRRGVQFVTRKVTKFAAHPGPKKLKLWTLEPRRDWGFSGDYVRAMWLMLQQDKPDDFVIGTGEDHSIKELLEVAFSWAGLDWRNWVEVCAPKGFTVDEESRFVADYAKAKRVLGWAPIMSFEELIHLMMMHDHQEGLR